MMLSPHFGLNEFLRSATATTRGIDNTPSAEHLENLRTLAGYLEQVRTLLGCPIIITSGYRSPELNRAVDGSATSSHCFGLAADFHAPGFGDDERVARAIAASRLKFDQLIFEQKNTHWVHLGVDPRMRREVKSWSPHSGFRSGVVILS